MGILESLKKIKNPNDGVRNSIQEISTAINSLESIKRELGDAVSPPTSSNSISSLPSDNLSWVVIIGADRTLKDANWEKDKVINNKGFKDVDIIYRNDSYKWYRTVIRFSTEPEAKEALPKIKNFQNDAYMRNLNEWCEKLEPKDFDQV